MHSTVLHRSRIYITACRSEDKEYMIHCNLIGGVRPGFYGAQNTALLEFQHTCITSLGSRAP